MARAHHSIEVSAPIERCYEIYTDYENYPQFMKNVERITRRGDGTLHWVVNGPIGSNVEFNARVKQEVPNEIVSWQTVEDSEIVTNGATRFESLSGERTRVTSSMEYETPAGVLGEMVAKVFSNPQSMLEEDLKNFKIQVESHSNRPLSSGSAVYPGATTSGSPYGNR